MPDLQERLRQAMARRPAIRPVDLARACKISTASVAGWRNGTTKSLRGETARLAAELLGCDRDWLATGVGNPRWADDPAVESPPEPPAPSPPPWPHQRFPEAYWAGLDQAERAVLEEAMLDAYDKLMARREQLQGAQATRKQLKPAA